MTLFFSGDNASKGCLKLHVTYGPVVVQVDEPIGHLRQVWHELGLKLEQAEQLEKAQTAKDSLHE